MTWEIINASVLDAEPGDGFDAVLCDPPYGLEFMGKGWDKGIPGAEFWTRILAACKPGAHLMAFGGTRTYHRLACAIEDAGWQIRDSLCWLYGSGFPKNLDVSKAIDKAAGAEREIVGRGVFGASAGMQNLGPSGIEGGEFLITAPATPDAIRWDGWGTSLKPAHEPVVLARKPLDGTVARNCLRHGCGGINIEGGRIGTGEDRTPGGAGGLSASDHVAMGDGWHGGKIDRPSGGRWPANLILDAEAAAMLDKQSGESKSTGGRIGNKDGGIAVPGGRFSKGDPGLGDTGGASRYFKVIRSDEQCGHELTRGVDTSAGKRTESNGGNSKAAGRGNSITGRFLPGTISTTRTETRSITSFPILSVSTGKLIGNCTVESDGLISESTASSIESVSVAENGDALIAFGNAALAPIKGIARIVSASPCESGATATENTTTPTTENTDGRASRAFYAAKASASERNAGLDGRDPCNVNDGRKTSIDNPYQRGDTQRKNTHPTVKPLDLCRYLATLLLPPPIWRSQQHQPRRILIPFSGSGSEMIGAHLAGWEHVVGIELEAEYCAIAEARLEHWTRQPELFAAEGAAKQLEMP